MDDIAASIAEIDKRIAVVRENLRELIEQAAAYSGASDEELADIRKMLDSFAKQKGRS